MCYGDVKPVEQSDVSVFVNEYKAGLAVQQAEDKIQGLSAAHCIVFAACIRHM